MIMKMEDTRRSPKKPGKHTLDENLMKNYQTKQNSELMGHYTHGLLGNDKTYSNISKPIKDYIRQTAVEHSSPLDILIRTSPLKCLSISLRILQK